MASPDAELSNLEEHLRSVKKFISSCDSQAQDIIRRIRDDTRLKLRELEEEIAEKQSRHEAQYSDSKKQLEETLCGVKRAFAVSEERELDAKKRLQSAETEHQAATARFLAAEAGHLLEAKTFQDKLAAVEAEKLLLQESFLKTKRDDENLRNVTLDDEKTQIQKIENQRETLRGKAMIEESEITQQIKGHVQLRTAQATFDKKMTQLEKEATEAMEVYEEKRKIVELAMQKECEIEEQQRRMEEQRSRIRDERLKVQKEVARESQRTAGLRQAELTAAKERDEAIHKISSATTVALGPATSLKSGLSRKDSPVNRIQQDGCTIVVETSDTAPDLESASSLSELSSAPDDIEFEIVDGIYTEPPCMKGVPERRITEQDPYWEPEWTPLPDDWDFPVHPNQILSKEYVTGKGLVNPKYITPLKSHLATLKRAGLTEAESIQWLRRRFAQMIREQQEQFFLRLRIVNLHKDDEEYMELLAKYPNLNPISPNGKISGKLTIRKRKG